MAAPSVFDMTVGEQEESWTTLGRAVVHQGRVTLSDHSVRIPDGSTAHYEVDESIPFAVATLVIDGSYVVLTRQYRYPIDRWIYDLPGGAGEAGEAPEEAARRELEEELGLIPADLRLLHTFFVNPGRAAWPAHIFVCTRAAAGGDIDRSDPAENVRSVRLRIVDLDSLIASGEIVDPTLIVARAAAATAGILPPLVPVPPGS